jgi:hypothetical protein
MFVSLSVYLTNISFIYFIESSAEVRNAVPSVSKRSKPLSGDDDRLTAVMSVKGDLNLFFFHYKSDQLKCELQQQYARSATAES